MNRKEAERITLQENVLQELGFTQDEARKLRRISMTLRRWYELECGDGNGCIERDESTGKAYWMNSNTMRRFQIADRESGAKLRLAKILNGKPLSAYLQTDPRGACLYIIRPGDVPDGQNVESCYSRGICVY